MTAHRRCMHGAEPAINWSRITVSQTEHQPQVYDTIFPLLTNRYPSPFPVCLGSSHILNVLRLRFSSHHWGDRIRILEKYPNPLPRCKRCESQVPSGRLNTRHYALKKFNQGEERRLRRDTLQRCFGESRVLFQINVETLPLSEAFPYLGRAIAYNNSDLAAVYQNLWKYW